MTYVDSWVREAHDEVAGDPVREQLLAELSQVHRSADARRIFLDITNFELDSKQALVILMRRVKEKGYNLTAALHDERLRKYVERTGMLALD